MRRTARFFVNVTLALFVVVVSWVAGLLISSAPMPVGGRVAGFQIDTVMIPGQAIACQQQGDQDWCQVTLLGQPLELRMTATQHEVQQCQFTYRSQTANCKGDYHAFIIGGWQPLVSTESSLGLSAEQQASLRDQYPQQNFFLYSVGESRLLQGATGVAIAAGVLMFLFGYVNFPRVSLFLGLSTFVVMWVVATVLVWGLGYVD